MSQVNHPSHYGGDTPYEAKKVIRAWDLGFFLGNAVKYISRMGKKDGETNEKDCRKAIWYLTDHLTYDLGAVSDKQKVIAMLGQLRHRIENKPGLTPHEINNLIGELQDKIHAEIT